MSVELIEFFLKKVLEVNLGIFFMSVFGVYKFELFNPL